MGKSRASLTRIYLDQYALSGSLNATNLGLDQPEIDITTFEDSGPRSLIDTYRTMAEVTGFGEFESTGIDKRLFALVGDENDHYLLHAFTGIAENSVVYEDVVRLTRKPLTAAIPGVQMINASFAGAGGRYRGLSLRQATITGTGNGTGRNLGATLAGQTFAVVFRVLSGTFTSIALKVQESSDNGVGDAYADIVGLTNTFTAVGVARKTTILATEAHKRIVVSGFTGTDAVVLVTAGRVL